MASPNEEYLLRQLATDDQEAFASIYAHYRPIIYRFVYKYLKSSELSDDICQDVFIKVWENRNELSKIKSFKFYLLTIAKNSSFDLLKRAKIESRIEASIVRTYAQTNNAVEEDLQSKEYQRYLQHALTTLPKQSREVFSLCRQQDQTYEEAAQHLGISRNGVKKHMVKSMKILKCALEKDLGISFGIFMPLLWEVM